MLTVTSAACERLARKLTHKKAGSDMMLRFVRREGGWSLRLDHSAPSDIVYAHQGRTVLAIDQEVSKTMQNRTLDVVNADRGSRLCLARDNAARRS